MLQGSAGCSRCVPHPITRSRKKGQSMTGLLLFVAFRYAAQSAGRGSGPVTGSISRPDQCSGAVVRRLASMSW